MQRLDFGKGISVWVLPEDPRVARKRLSRLEARRAARRAAAARRRLGAKSSIVRGLP